MGSRKKATATGAEGTKPEAGKASEMPPPSPGSSLARRASVVGVFTLLSRILGYARDALMAYVFGAGVASDAFFAAQTIPNTLRRLVAEGTLMIAFVPLLTEEKEAGGKTAMRAFIGAVLGALLPVLFVLVGLGMLFPEGTVKLFAAGFDAERTAAAVPLTRLMMPFLFFVSLLAVASGVLNTQGCFAAPAAAPIVLNLSMIVCIGLLHRRFDQPITAAAWGVVLGGLLQLLMQLPQLAREGLLVPPKVHLQHPAVQTLAARMLPAVFGVGVYQLNMVVIRQLASFLPEGQLSCYYYAARLQEFALGVFAVSISVAALPTLSEHAARGDRAQFLSTFRGALRATTFITTLAFAGLVSLARPIVATLFERGAFEAASAQQTADLVLIFAFALIPTGAIRVMVPTLYAVGDTKTPVAAAALSLATTVVLGWTLSFRFEILGLAAATAVATLGQAIALSLWIKPRLEQRLPAGSSSAFASGKPPSPGLAGHTIRCALAAVPGTMVTFAVASTTPFSNQGLVRNGAFLALFGGLLIGSYFGVSHLLGIEQPRQFGRVLRQRILRTRKLSAS